MKTIKLVAMILSLSVMYQFANAQGCPSNKVRMSKGYKGQCGCHCNSKCVLQSEVPTYINNGWYTGACYDIGNFCCSNWVRLDGADDVPATETSLTSVYPNPASGSAAVSFYLSQMQRVSFRLFDFTGRLVATLENDFFEEGENEFIWNASGTSAGVYLLRMETESYSETRKVSVIK